MMNVGHSTVQCNTVQFSAIQCSAVQYSIAVVIVVHTSFNTIGSEEDEGDGISHVPPTKKT